MKISSKGQVVIPAPIRDAYGWNAGTEVVVKEVRPTIITFKKRAPEKSLARKYRGSLKGLLPSTKEYLREKELEKKLEDRWVPSSLTPAPY